MARAREAQVIVTLGWRGRGGRFATQTRWDEKNVTIFVSEETSECFPIRSTRMTAQTAMTCSSKCRVYQVGLNLSL